MKITNRIPLFVLGFIAFLSSAFVNPSNTNTLLELPATVNPSFVEFLSLFEKVEMPFEVGLDDFEKYENKKTENITVKKSKKRKYRTEAQILRDYLQSKISVSRMGPPVIMPIARFYPDEETIAVIYRSYMSNLNFGSSYHLALFNMKGEKLPKRKNAKFASSFSHLLGQSSPYGATQTFIIDTNGQIVQKTYKAIWKNDVEKHGIKNNEITDYVLEKTDLFEIQKKGIVAAKVKCSEDRASL